MGSPHALVFASLGPTAYELVEKPDSETRGYYNIIVGHLVALGAGFLALLVLHTWNSPKVTVADLVSAPRLWTAVLAVLITTAATLLLKASQPAALSTTLLVSLGSMQRGRDALAIIIGVLILTALGEPVRRYVQYLQKKEKYSVRA